MGNLLLKVEKVVLHCSDTPDDNDKYGAKQIDHWHKQRGWDGIGYHWVIKRSGVVESGRDMRLEGAHTLRHNHNSYGVCYIGRNNPSTAQITSILILYAQIYHRTKIKWDKWFGHYEFNPGKTCPGFPMDMFRYILERCIDHDDPKAILPFPK